MNSVEIPRTDRPVRAVVRVPPSKSLQQRALALAVLAEGVSTIRAVGPFAQDVDRLALALAVLAGRPVPPAGRVEGGITPQGWLGSGRESRSVHLGANATGLRIATALACLRPPGARTLLRGDPALLRRPHGPLLRALCRLGGHALRKPSGSLRVVAGGLARGAVALPAHVSSQYATALMLAAPRFGGVEVGLVGEAVSTGYLRLTVDALGTFGVPVEDGENRYRAGDAPPRACDFVVEPDASCAAVWWAIAALTGGDVAVEGIPSTSRQPDLALLGILGRMGARVLREGDLVRVSGPATLAAPGDVDLREAPDLAPLVGALGALAQGTTRVVRAPHLRHKESDRVDSVVAALRALGGDAQPTNDGFTVRGGPLRGALVPSRGDHRLVMALSALGCVVPGVRIAGASAVRKSYPGFLEALALVVAGEGASSAPR